MAHWVSKIRIFRSCSRIPLRLAFQPSIQSRRTFSLHASARPLTWCRRDASRRQRCASRSHFASATSGGGDDIDDGGTDLTPHQTPDSSNDSIADCIANSIADGIDADADLANSIASEDATSSDTVDTGFLRKSVHDTDLSHSENLDQDEPTLNDGTCGSQLETNTSDYHSYTDDSTDPTKPITTINLSDFPRSKDGGIVIYPDIHFHNKGNKPDPSSLGGEGSDTRRGGSDPSAFRGGAKDSIFEQKEYDLRNLLYNIQKSKADKDRAAVAEKRTDMMTVEQLVQFLREHNARDVCVIQLPPELDYVEYFVVCTALGIRHIGRMADSLQAEVGYIID